MCICVLHLPNRETNDTLAFEHIKIPRFKLAEAQFFTIILINHSSHPINHHNIVYFYLIKLLKYLI